MKRNQTQVRYRRARLRSPGACSSRAVPTMRRATHTAGGNGRAHTTRMPRHWRAQRTGACTTSWPQRQHPHAARPSPVRARARIAASDRAPLNQPCPSQGSLPRPVTHTSAGVTHGEVQCSAPPSRQEPMGLSTKSGGPFSSLIRPGEPNWASGPYHACAGDLACMRAQTFPSAHHPGGAPAPPSRPMTGCPPE